MSVGVLQKLTKVYLSTLGTLFLNRGLVEFIPSRFPDIPSPEACGDNFGMMHDLLSLPRTIIFLSGIDTTSAEQAHYHCSSHTQHGACVDITLKREVSGMDGLSMPAIDSSQGSLAMIH